MKRMCACFGTTFLLVIAILAPALTPAAASGASPSPAVVPAALMVALLMPDVESGHDPLQSVPEGGIGADGRPVDPLIFDASIASCDAAMLRCYSSCSRSPFDRDGCYRRCDVNYVNCQ